MNRYVYHAPSEISPRANASGGQNVVRMGALEMAPMAVTAPRNWYGGPSYPIAIDQRVSVSDRVCPAWGCAGPPLWFGARVPQPPPSSGTSLLISNTGTLPVSPQPSPTVSAPTPLALTDPGQTLAQQTGTPWDLKTWLGESTLISGFPNWGIAAAGAAALFMFFGGKGRR